MSQIRTEHITCPQCHKESEIELWSSINVSLDPELREKVFTNELWAWKCPHCGYETFIPWGTIYHDMENRFMLFFEFDDEDVKDKYSPMELLTGIGNMDGYVFRAVYGLNNLKEKIHILEEHLNDVAIERLRYMVRHIIRPNIAAIGSPLYLQGVEREANDQSEYGSLYFIYFTEENGEESTQQLQMPMEIYFEHEFAVKNDPRMALNGNVCVDEEWMKRQLSKSK